MHEILPPRSTRKNKFRSAVVFAGLLAGTLDAIGAIAIYLMKGGKDPIKIFNYIASGVFGKAAFSGGLPMAFMGFLFHLIIATIWAFLFFLVYHKARVLSKNWFISGLGYGVLVWLGMNLIVVPLSSTPPMSHNASSVLEGMLVLMICIGLPVSYFARKHFQ